MIGEMKVRLKEDLLVITAETADEEESLSEWTARVDGHVFVLKRQDAMSFRLTDLGPRESACRVPINVASHSPDPEIRLISNLAHTPFELDGLLYGSVEAFWQGLKFADEDRRREIALLHGPQARTAGNAAMESTVCKYRGQAVRVGTCQHWHLMDLACRAKFTQHEGAQRALLSTGDRPLQHKMRIDSLTIPGVIMADIWMRIRRTLAHPAVDDDA
jgi:predicted NAD-dependent protein-ADP-ribosyltransferase YbiA (DUF1768 family)